MVDASIMPTMLSSNLNAGALMIGEKGAAHILDKKLPAAEGVKRALIYSQPRKIKGIFFKDLSAVPADQQPPLQSQKQRQLEVLFGDSVLHRQRSQTRSLALFRQNTDR